MADDLELLTLPYDSPGGQSLLSRLIAELGSSEWTRFRAAVAFLSASGTYDQLIDAIDKFAADGGAVSLTVGADVFGPDGAGSDYEAVNLLLDRFASRETVSIHLYHERGRTFHPKVYLFDDVLEGRALAIVGSSNLSRGGLVNNIEANLVARLNRSKENQWAVFQRLDDCFKDYWTEA